MTILARDLMTTGVETVRPDDEVSEVLTSLAREEFNGYPVVEDERVVGIVTQHDLVHLFQPSDRTLWIPVGVPPFSEVVDYAFDLSWDELDASIDMVKNAGKPVRSIMTTDVVTVAPDDDIDFVLDLLADDERDINRLPVVEGGQLVGIIARQDVIRAIRDERRSERESAGRESESTEHASGGEPGSK